MGAQKYILAFALAAVAPASAAPQALDFSALAAAPTVATGPPAYDGDSDPAQETASLYTSFEVTGAATTGAAVTTAASNNNARDLEARWWWPTPPKPTTTKATTPTTKATSPPATTATTGPYTPYYPALATSYTTDPALTATTTSGQACPTQPEAGTYCGFINPEDPCAPQPDGYGPVPTPDTPSAFLAFPTLHSLARAAPTSVPSVNGTSYKQSFEDLNASINSNSYLGLDTLKTYDTAACAAACDSNALCTAFNLYAERDPSLNPSTPSNTAPTVWGNNCPNPPSMTSFKCTLWGSSINSTMATNTGENRASFQVVITASNGYNRVNPVPQTPSGCRNPQPCGPKAISSGDQWIGSRFFPGPFNPQVCSDYAAAQNAFNKKAGSGSTCKMFNAYYLFRNGVPFGTNCALYGAVLGPEHATYGGGSSSDGYHYSIQQSWTWEFGF